MGDSTQRVTVLGAGSWGTALAHLNARAGHDVTLVCEEGAEDPALRDCRVAKYRGGEASNRFSRWMKRRVSGCWLKKRAADF